MTFVPENINRIPTRSEDFAAGRVGGFFPVDTDGGDVEVQLSAVDQCEGLYWFKNVGSGVLVIKAADDETIDGEAVLELVDQYASAAIAPGVDCWWVF